jgi:hypothetical protein
VIDANGQSLAYVYGRETKADAAEAARQGLGVRQRLNPKQASNFRLTRFPFKLSHA